MNRALLVALLFPIRAAAFDYGEFTANLQTDAGRAAVRVWLDGFGRGVGMYEARQAMDHRQRRFCPPQGTPLSPELLAGLVGETVKQQPSLAKTDMPVAAIIWVGLERQFPCKAPVSG